MTGLRYYTGTLLFLLAGAAAGMGWWRTEQAGLESPEPRALGPQCGHWSIRRCCELLGVPVSMPTILELLPPRPQGHSLLEISRVLETIGLETEGRHETLETLSDKPFPCIAHLQNPNHFVVLAGVDERRVHLFDGAGHRTSRSAEAFATQWSGNILLVERPRDPEPLPLFAPPPRQPAPLIQFESLFVDKGTVSAHGDPIPFVYGFRNLGNQDLLIGNIAPDCTCMEVEAPEGPIAPGSRAKIKLVYHPQQRAGPFFHQAVVETNDPRFPVLRLKASGYVDELLDVMPRRLDLGRAIIGRKCSAELFLQYSGSRDEFAVERLSSSLSGITLRKISAQQQDRNGGAVLDEAVRIDSSVNEMRIVQVILNPSPEMSGDVEGTIEILTDVQDFEQLSIPVSAHVVQPVVARPSLLSFGEVVPNEQVEVTTTLVSLSDEAFRVTVPDHLDAAWHCAPSAEKPSAKKHLTLVTTGSTALAMGGSAIEVRGTLVESEEEFAISLPVYAFRAERAVSRSSATLKTADRPGR